MRELCKINGKPYYGFCVVEECYKDCRCLDNFMCWRDDVLLD